ncbi:hypothetical protein [Brevundimonas sp.]|uniref:hypothetical protein n=1 Tax=Brevundimonas sp. TaxID=1871086 RepID=UPI0035ADDCCD
MDDTSERLVRVETKLDSLISLNDQRISAAERRIDEVRAEAAERTRHEKANYDQKLQALRAEVEKRATAEEVSYIRAGQAEVKSDIKKGVWVVIIAVFGAVLASSGISATSAMMNAKHYPSAITETR